MPEAGAAKEQLTFFQMLVVTAWPVVQATLAVVPSTE